ncbi:MAG: hypothetical protein HY680_03480 [Chloroflexi bacterium]|nr:hypothetical protein [Chloroflexota bacterium]
MTPRRSSQQSNGQAQMMSERPLHLLMDGHAMVHRAYHAIQQPMTVRRTGEMRCASLRPCPGPWASGWAGRGRQEPP